MCRSDSGIDFVCRSDFRIVFVCISDFRVVFDKRRVLNVCTLLMSTSLGDPAGLL